MTMSREYQEGKQTQEFSPDPLPPQASPDVDTESEMAGLFPLLRKDRPTLAMLKGPNLGAVYPLVGDELVMGRSDEAQVKLDDPGLSRRHVRFFRQGDHVYVEDLQSKNGTFVESDRIDTPRQLRDGQRIQLGKHTLLKFSLQDALEQETARQMYEWTIRDPLTRLFNRRYLEERIEGEFTYAQRHGSNISILMIDVDHFKKLNDQYGHQAGDSVLSVLATFLNRILRTEDMAARYGGEEFVIMVRDISHGNAITLAERVRRSIEGLTLPWGEETMKVSVSIGVATHTIERPVSDARALLKTSDVALYRAKTGGRNCVRG